MAMKIRVNPTRMAMLKQRRRLAVARRGHKLMKDKLEGLVRVFMDCVDDYVRLRDEIDQQLPKTLRYFLLANGASGEEAVNAALEDIDVKVNLSMTSKRVMSVPFPTIALEGFQFTPAYSALTTTTDFDLACQRFRDVFPTLLQLASKEEALIRLADEIEKTRRRVNALEYVLIPGVAAAIKEIAAKLEEAERSNRARLMKVKSMLMESGK